MLFRLPPLFLDASIFGFQLLVDLKSASLSPLLFLGQMVRVCQSNCYDSDNHGQDLSAVKPKFNFRSRFFTWCPVHVPSRRGRAVPTPQQCPNRHRKLLPDLRSDPGWYEAELPSASWMRRAAPE